MGRNSAMIVAAAAAALPGASTCARAAPCTMANLASYISGANATCTVLDKTISGVSASAPFVESLATVVPVTVANDPGLEFMLTGFSTAGGVESATITFTIAAPASAPMTDASNAVTGSATGGGAFGASEVLSNGITLAASNLTPLSAPPFQRERRASP